jgi:hypothetical protein
MEMLVVSSSVSTIRNSDEDHDAYGRHRDDFIARYKHMLVG